MRKRLCFAVALGALSALGILPLNAVFAQSDEAFIKYRQKVMSSNGANISSIGAILKNKLPYSANIAGHARNINTGAKMIAAAFKKELHQVRPTPSPKSGRNGANSRTPPRIWRNKAPSSPTWRPRAIWRPSAPSSSKWAKPVAIATKSFARKRKNPINASADTQWTCFASEVRGIVRGSNA